MDSSSYGAHAYALCSARDSVCARPRTALLILCAWVHGMSRVLAANPSNGRK
jgi:hypothetical protein